MRDHAANSSDLERSRLLSLRLSRRQAGERVPLSRPPAPAAPPLPAPAEEDLPPPIEQNVEPPKLPTPPAFESWEELIKWSLETLGAEGGFVVDSQGFVIATGGRLDPDGFEGMGAELCFAMEQLERIDPNAGDLLWVDLEFGRRRIVCLRAAPKEGDQMLLGFAGIPEGYLPLRHQFEKLVVEVMPHLV